MHLFIKNVQKKLKVIFVLIIILFLNVLIIEINIFIIINFLDLDIQHIKKIYVKQTVPHLLH